MNSKFVFVFDVVFVCTSVVFFFRFRNTPDQFCQLRNYAISLLGDGVHMLSSKTSIVADDSLGWNQGSDEFNVAGVPV